MNSTEFNNLYPHLANIVTEYTETAKEGKTTDFDLFFSFIWSWCR